MARFSYRSVQVYRCTTCGGMYLELEEQRTLFRTKASYSPLSEDSDRAPRHCFRCSIDMVPLEDSDGRILDRCEICQAIFIDWGQA